VTLPLRRSLSSAALCCLALFSLSGSALAGAFVFADAVNGVDVVTHPTGYDGDGGTLSVEVCIDPTSVHAAAMEPSVEYSVATWNVLLATTANLKSGGANDVPSGSLDFESVFLHELGHCIGLAHANLASESGLPTAQQDHTKSTTGGDGLFDPDAGSDGIEGSHDDQRDDDVNLHWFEIAQNHPFQTVTTTFDSTAFSRLLSDLPPGHDYVRNGDRDVAVALSTPNTEAVMQQGTSLDEAQRSLSHDDVATIRYAMSGIDELQGTSDDYTLALSYVGMTTSCDIVVDFDNSQTGLAVCSVGGEFITDPPPGQPFTTDHIGITSAEIFFNSNFSWFFSADCGDSVIAGSETCDDGGTTPGDGCDAVCAIETGYQCSGEPSACSTTCGDGVIAGSEICDDGGTTPGDGCDAVCAIETGYQCSGEPSVCDPILVPLGGAVSRLALALSIAAMGAILVRSRHARSHRD
jgi:cysteine-rich repeat protein